MSKFTPYFSIADAICRLFHPHVEVVLHNIKTGRIEAIYNPFSKRTVGEDSQIQKEETFPEVFPVYTKTHWNGKTIKSVTAPLRDLEGHIFGLLCINLDISKWEEIADWLTGWIQTGTTTLPNELFREDWKEKIHVYVSHYLQKEQTSLSSLNTHQKKRLVLSIQKEGGFSVKHAASYVADILGISRATVYNYLKSEA